MLTGTHADDVPVSGFATTVGIGGALPSTTGPAACSVLERQRDDLLLGGFRRHRQRTLRRRHGVVDGVVSTLELSRAVNRLNTRLDDGAHRPQK